VATYHPACAADKNRFSVENHGIAFSVTLAIIPYQNITKGIIANDKVHYKF
jgi:hypothetical protein